MTSPIVVRRSRHERVELGAPLRPRAGLLVGVVLLLAAGVPLLSPSGPTPFELLVTFALGVFALWLVRASLLGRGRALTLEQGALNTGSEQIPLSDARFIELAGRLETDDGMVRGSYVAELCSGNKRRTALLAHDDPARLLADLSRILAAFAIPVQSGWGLPESALRALLDPRQAARPVSSNTDTPQTAGQQRDLEAPPVEPSARRSAMTALLVAGVMLSGLFAFFLRSSSHVDRPMHALSLILPVSTSLLVIGLGLFVATRRIRVSYDGELCIETRALGFVLRRLRVPKTALIGAWAVSPDSGPALHVLIATTSGPLAIRCSAQTARELAADLMRPLAECDA